MKPILLIDNYDSFTYNLVHLVEAIPGFRVEVALNDQISIAEAAAYHRILLSPGPGIPSEAGNLLELIKALAPTHHLMGVCLGQQAIGEVMGARLLNLNDVFHGVATPLQIRRPDHFLFQGIPDQTLVGRYHSWVIDPQSVPASMEVLAVDENEQIMAIQHREWKVCGVQFHPESILTPMGKQLMENWLRHG